MEKNLPAVQANKTAKYFKYAIGEIALVMIGILLALQVNNWNEQRKQAKAIDKLMTAFENELNSNIKTCNYFITYGGYSRDSIATLYKNNKITRDYRGGHLSFSTATQQFIDDNLDEFIENEKQIPDKYTFLIPELKELKRRIESQRRWEKAAIEISMARRKELTDTFPWFWLRDSLDLEKRTDHILNDPIYKSKLLHYNHYQLNENVWDVNIIRTSSVALLWEIKKLRLTTDIPIKGFLESLNLKPLEKLACNSAPYTIKEEIGIGKNAIIYNNTNNTVFYNIINLDGKIMDNGKAYEIPAKSFELDEWDLSNDELIQYIANDSCKAVYQLTKEDYLILN